MNRWIFPEKSVSQLGSFLQISGSKNSKEMVQKRGMFTLLKLTVRTWKWMVGIPVSFWDGLFSGAMLVSGRVHVERDRLRMSSMSFDRWELFWPRLRDFWPSLSSASPESFFCFYESWSSYRLVSKRTSYFSTLTANIWKSSYISHVSVLSHICLVTKCETGNIGSGVEGHMCQY